MLCDDTNQDVGQRIYQELCSRKIEAEYISISNADIKPCYSCGGCTNKTYGRCVVRDDGDTIYPKLISSDVWLIVTPLMFGCYSFKTKRVLDKCGLIGDRHYYVIRGELVKKMQGKLRKIYAIGVMDDCSVDEKTLFTNLVAENTKIMNVLGGSFVVGSRISDVDISDLVKEICR
jgi:multimeric flavodoxin WrbA